MGNVAVAVVVTGPLVLVRGDGEARTVDVGVSAAKVGVTSGAASLFASVTVPVIVPVTVSVTGSVAVADSAGASPGVNNNIPATSSGVVRQLTALSIATVVPPRSANVTNVSPALTR